MSHNEPKVVESQEKNTKKISKRKEIFYFQQLYGLSRRVKN